MSMSGGQTFHISVTPLGMTLIVLWNLRPNIKLCTGIVSIIYSRGIYIYIYIRVFTDRQDGLKTVSFCLP